MARWRDRRIGIDLDKVSRFTLLKTYFNARYFYPDVPIDVKATAHGVHIRIHKKNSLQENINARRLLGDDSTRIFADEMRIRMGLPEWVDTLFNFKHKHGKTTREESMNILSLPFCSRLPCRKRNKHKEAIKKGEN